ncbi:MFS transporter [Desulfosporosinus sp. PR]|uniref:MFS transporter n=1 Tax=Candidatus Desulfosporosinus nitrosoreducens TaxID=3401928 RepID=UPI0027F3DABF|nr:MFS transporter [Desulfosporosinus sp. PR]MDQ7094394.1 MFS transporter [Desulfosporosinus sp. PR]
MKKIMSLYFAIMFIIGTDTFLISPLLPTLRTSFNISVETSGLLVSAYAIGYAVFALIAGPLSDIWNRKKVMLFGILGFSVSTFLCAFAVNFWMMFLFRMLAGIFAAFTSPQVWATIPILVPSEKITKAMGIASAGFAVSQTLGVPIGTYLAAHSWKTPFYIIGGCALLLFILIFLVVPDFKPTVTDKQSSMFGRYVTLLQKKTARISYLSYFALLIGAFAVFTFASTWLSDKFSLSVSGIGNVMVFVGLGNFIGSFLGSNIIIKLGRRNALISGTAIMGVLYVLITFSPSILLINVGFFLIYLAFGSIFPIVMAHLQSLTTTSRGTVAALSNVTNYAATTLGAYLAGILYVQFRGFIGVTVFAGICCLISIELWTRNQMAENQRLSN